MLMPEFPTRLPPPPHYDANKVDKVWRVPYEERANQARAWAEEHKISPALNDHSKIELLCIDVQNTFCIPEFELYVGGRSLRGPIEDNQRLVNFIYQHLNLITHISFTMDTHKAMQIFHSIFLVDNQGNSPDPLTLVSVDDIRQGRWKFNSAIAHNLGISPETGQQHLEHYTSELEKNEKFDLTIWPYHALLGGIGHALVSSVEEAIFFHTIARQSQPDIIIKGENPLTEHYSAVGPEVLTKPNGEQIGRKNRQFHKIVLDNDALIIAGQAKSHCVAWTIEDMLSYFQENDPEQLQKIYLLEDCTSPVVVPDVVDFTEQAEAAFQRFAEAGMKVVRSTEPITSWLEL